MPTELTVRVTKTRIMSQNPSFFVGHSQIKDSKTALLLDTHQDKQLSSMNSQQKEHIEVNTQGQAKPKSKTQRQKDVISGSSFNFQIVCEIKFADQIQTSHLFTQTDFSEQQEETKLENGANNENVWQGQLNIDSLFKFDIFLDDEMIQEHQVTVSLKDQNKNGSVDTEDCIGVTQIDLSSLLFKKLPQKSKGWFPVYSVDKGITGEVYLELCLIYQPDLAVERPAGFYQPKIAYFSSKAPPYFEVKQIMGFVEELVDFKLSNTIQEDQIALQDAILRLRRRLGRIVQKKGGNTVICYRQSIDHTGDLTKRVILRGYGTAVLLQLDAVVMAESKSFVPPNSISNTISQSDDKLLQQTNAQFGETCQQNFGNTIYGDNIGSKESQQLLGQNKQNPQVESYPQPWTPQKTLFDGQVKHKVQLITTDALPQDNGTSYSVKFGSTVTACAVRKLSSFTVYEQEASKRLTSKIASEWNQWWGQVRQEIQISAKALNCSHVMGYREQVSINQQILVLEAYGTAVQIRAKQSTNSLQRQQNSQMAPVQQQQRGVQGDSKNSKDLRMVRETSVGTSFPQRINSSGGGGKKFQTSKIQDLRGKNKSIQFEHQSPLLRNMQSSFPQVFPQIAQSAQVQDKQPSDGAATSAQGSDQQKNQQKIISEKMKVKEDILACRFCHIVPPRKKDMFQDEQQKAISQQQQEKFQHKCLICDDKYVPETIIATIDPPDGLQIIGKPILLEARAIKSKKLNPRRTQKEDHFLMTLNDQVFVTKYHLHNQLLTKMRLAGKNALFSYRAKIKINHDSITGIARGTALCLRALPLPKPIKIVPNSHLLSELVHQGNGLDQQSSTTQNLFKIIGEYSQFNVRMVFEQDITSIQSPYTYLRVLPRKRAAQNLIINGEELGTNLQMENPETAIHEQTKVIKKEEKEETNAQKIIINVNLKKKTEYEEEKRQLFQEPPFVQQKSIKHNLRDGKIKSVACVYNDEISCDLDEDSSQFLTAQSSQVNLVNDQQPNLDNEIKEVKSIEDENKDPETPRENKFFLLQHKDSLQGTIQSKQERQQRSGMKDETKMTVIVHDPYTDVQNKLQRIDFSGLKPDPLNDDEELPHIVRFRSGSMEDKANMELLVASQKPQVLVIRSKKQSLDEEVAREQLEVESYKFRLDGRTKATWTKETILSGSYTKIPNKRALNALQIWQQTKDCEQMELKRSTSNPIEELVDIYNNNRNFTMNNANQGTDFFELTSKQRTKQWEDQNNNHQLLALQEQKTAISVLKLKKCGLALPLTTPDTIQVDKNSEKREQKVENNLLAVKVDPQEIPIEDQNDIEILQTLLDPIVPPQVVLLTTQYDMVNFNFQNQSTIKKVSFFSRLYRYDLYRDQRNKSHKHRNQSHQRTNQMNSKSKNSLLETEFNRIMQGAQCDLVSDLIKEGFAPCVVCSLRTQEKFHSDNFVDIFFTCCVLQSSQENSDSQALYSSKKVATQNNVGDKKSDQIRSLGETDSQFGGSQLQHYLLKMASKEFCALTNSNLNLPAKVVNQIDKRTGQRVGKVNNSCEQNTYWPKVQLSSALIKEEFGSQNSPSVEKMTTRGIKQGQTKESSKSSFFSFLCGGSKKEQKTDKECLQTIRYCKLKILGGQKIKMLPMSVYPGLTIKKHFGLVDVHLFRKIYLGQNVDFISKYQKTSCSQAAESVQKAIDELIEDLGEVIGSRVRSLGGNGVTGIRFDLNWLDANPSHNWQNQGDSLKEYTVIVSGTGDAVQLEES